MTTALLRCFAGIVALAAVLSLRADPPLPTIPAATFNVATYGAVGDGVTTNTAAIQAALNAARTGGGGTVEIPAAAGAYLSGPLTIFANTNLQVDAGAVLQALPMSKYGPGTIHFITVNTNSTNVKISGAGAIDGNGADWWAAFATNSGLSRPRLVQVNHTTTMAITGLTVRNSPSFHLAFSATDNVTIDGVTISAPATAPNSDGIDPAGNHYLIKNCHISVGDDNIAIKPGSSAGGDYLVTNCAFGTGHGLSMGGQTNFGFDGLTVTNCTFDGTTSGLRLKADATEGGIVQNLTYSNLTMNNVQYPIVFYSYYNRDGTPGAASGSNQITPTIALNWNASPPDPLNVATLPVWRNITVNNVTAASGSAGPGYSIIWGLPNRLISAVTLNNVQLTGYTGFELYNVQNVQFTGTTSVGPLVTANAQVIVTQPQPQSVALGGTAHFSVGVADTAGSTGPMVPTYRWTFNGQPLADGPRADGAAVAGSTTAALTVTNVHAAEIGSYAVQVTHQLDAYSTTLVPNSASVIATSAAATLSSPTVTTAQIARGPGSLAAIPGQTVLLGVTATGLGSLSYQWQLNGQPLADGPGIGGSMTASLLLTNVQSASAGAYTVVVSDSGAPVTSAPGVLTVGPTANPGRLVNLSVRTTVSASSNLIAGFVLSAPAGTTSPKRLLVRAVGPTLANFGVSNPLPDPVLQLYSGQTVVTSNDDWAGDPAVVAVANQVGAFALPAGSADAALLLAQPPGAYAAVVTAKPPGSGTTLVELYDADAATTVARLVNVSSRGTVTGAAGSLIAGFVVGGSTARTVLIRATGPALAAFGVSGGLADPQLQVFDSAGRVIAANDDWSGDATVSAISAQVGAFALTSATSKDSALIVTLPAGAYSAVVSGGGTTGVALLELYDVP